ncbi:MAG: hypothetical protein MUP70_02415 [Candidatus Aminicenantes bacterium]|nr:hypothetical protein [Candidatus Aminicenantes bacterium]
MVNSRGTTILLLMFFVALLGIGLLAAVPVWKTQIQREWEEELIFRGNQYVEAIRLFTIKNPGTYPDSLEILHKEKFIRKLFSDPMTEDGEWNIILLYSGTAAADQSGIQKVLIAPYRVLQAMAQPRIIGVVSSSRESSIQILDKQESYDKWLFFMGKNPEQLPEIVYFGEDDSR